MDEWLRGSTTGLAEVPKGSFWKSEIGSVFEVTETWPSIGGTTLPRFTLKHLSLEKEYVWNYNEMRASRLKEITPEEVPLALLGGS
jgi:hypothetical protein